MSNKFSPSKNVHVEHKALLCECSLKSVRCDGSPCLHVNCSPSEAISCCWGHFCLKSVLTGSFKRPGHNALHLIGHLDAWNNVPVSSSWFVSFPAFSPFDPDPRVTPTTPPLVWTVVQRSLVIQSEISHLTSLFQSCSKWTRPLFNQLYELSVATWNTFWFICSTNENNIILQKKKDIKSLPPYFITFYILLWLP